LVNYNNSSSYQSRLDHGAGEHVSAAAEEAKVNLARKQEILKAAKEFTAFADNGPSGVNTRNYEA
jgi:hypothetical protein